MIGALTGGIACGKSTAAGFFAGEEFGTIDADRVVHELLASDEPTIATIEKRFGPKVLASEGGVDRRRLGAIVFSDAGALEWLERLIHPLVGKAWRTAVATDPERDWIVQIPLLFEKKLESSFDFTVCVGADAEVQFRRLDERGLGKEDAAGRIFRQLPLARKVELADHYLHNNGSLEFLHAQVTYLVAHLRDRVSRRNTHYNHPNSIY